MRILVLAITAFLLFEPPMGCSFLGRRVPDEAYPETVGRFSRVYILHGGQRDIATKYVDQRRPDQHSIGMELALGDLLESSLSKCSTENLSKVIDGARVIKAIDLNNRTKTKVGNIRICQDREQGAANFYLEMTNGDVSFFIRTNNLYGEDGKTVPLSLGDIVEFARAIPFNSDLEINDPL